MLARPTMLGQGGPVSLSGKRSIQDVVQVTPTSRSLRAALPMIVIKFVARSPSAIEPGLSLQPSTIKSSSKTFPNKIHCF